MWTIDLSVFGASTWFRTAARYDSADQAVDTMLAFPRKDCYGRNVLYRTRRVDELDLQYDADRAALHRAA